ncbi:chromosomal replication initiator DnaA [Fusobacterium perfoetens]|uniref:chromosomal replication initiator DnaA n=1 Tax=Fusobacterium perfoetens TaxID=852 RepID=UPI0015A279B3|nr:chromosomal replication initiator DnaA [Fusobacterium perfoetens]MCF2625689.1 chromosomal replication initiator DnaA [Fusobacterium perfoetens]
MGEDNKNKTDLLESFNIISSGSLSEDIQKMDMKLSTLPDIEVREVVIKETGNFLNLQGNIINIPIEMIVFPFFTPQKQNKRINFQYSFEDLGVTMYCTLVAKDNNDKVYQPSIFEEKIYNYLISMYEAKKEADIDEEDEYIEFEISDFIVNFLGNKMNRAYYTKVEQALKNLKSTEYQFIVSNHTKFGKYKFEDEEFKLLTYQKLKKGKKVYYRVILNKNIRKKIKDKRYIKYNSRALMEILTKDPIAGRIYKYISKIRYETMEGKINLRTLAAIIPLKMEQETERPNKNGQMKTYILSRAKQVLKRVLKAYEVLQELGYIKEFSYEEEKKENTYYINYSFNPEKDGECHVSTFIENKSKNSISKKSILAKEKEVIIEEDDSKYSEFDYEAMEEAEVIEVKDTIVSKEEKTNKIVRKSVSRTKKVETYEDLPENIVALIHKAKRNIYISRSWDKRTDTKIRKIYNEDGEEIAVEVLKIIYKNLNKSIKTTLVQYINGVLKNLYKSDTPKQNLQLFNNDVKEKTIISKRKIKQARKGIKAKTLTNAIRDLKDEVGIPRDILIEFEKLDDYEKLKVEEKALKLCSEEAKVSETFLLTMKEKSKVLYLNTIKKYIEKVLDENY